MTKKNKNDIIDHLDPKYDLNALNQNIADTCTEIMKIYGANDNIMRHLSSVYDGLKVGERRILYTMYEMGLKHSGGFKKVMSIIGRAMDYHPHGDTSIADTLVKLAQPWNNIQCCVMGHGNFASVEDESYGAPRYIEAKLSYFAYKCFFEEFSLDIVNTRHNFSMEKLEPEYLPSKYPNVMINNVFGIGYGAGTNICTFNLKEVLELTRILLRDPEYKKVTLYPDSPTGASIVDEGQFKQIAKTGRGKFRSRGVIDVDEERNALIVRNTPLQRYWGPIAINIVELYGKDGKSGHKLSQIRYEKSNDPTQLHAVLFLKKEVNPYELRNEIYAKTDMEITATVNFTLTDVYTYRQYNIRDILLTWIDFRRETKQRIIQNKLSQKKERAHMIDIVLFLLSGDNAENFITIMKNSSNKKEICARLMKGYGLTSLQSDYVAGLKGYQYSKESRDQYKREREDLEKDIRELEKIIVSDKLIDDIIDEELREGIELFGSPRKSKIITIDNENAVPNTKHIVAFSKSGLVKKLPKGVKTIGNFPDGDYPTEVIECNNLDTIFLFDSFGKTFKVPVSSINSSTLDGHGTSVNSICGMTGELVSVKPYHLTLKKKSSKKNKDVFVLMVTSEGILKKTVMDQYHSIRTSANSIIMNDSDRLVGVLYTDGDTDIVIYTNKGNGVRINSSEFRATSRLTKGIKSIDLEDSEFVIGMDVIYPDDKYILVLTNNGKAKKCSLEYFQLMQRNSKPLKIVDLGSSDEIKLVRSIHGEEEFRLFMWGNTPSIFSEDVPELPRMSKAKKMVPVPKGEVIIDIKEVVE